MKSFILQECALEQRAEQLEKLASSKETLTYQRNLSEAEIDTESKSMASLYKDLVRVEAEKSAAMKEYGETIKSIRAQIEVKAGVLTDGKKEVSETCYKFIDIDAREVGFYNRYGELVRCRPAQDADLQLNMFGNNDVDEQHAIVGALPAADPNAEYEEAQIVIDFEGEEETASDDEPSESSIFDD